MSVQSWEFDCRAGLVCPVSARQTPEIRRPPTLGAETATGDRRDPAVRRAHGP
jgi:hypothetical protein